MNKTKKKILSVSLRLFNARGISNVSLRDIASEAGISVGNLQYHFKKREDIIESHYYELVEKIDRVSVVNTSELLKSFINISEEIMTVFYAYRFFLLDFITITRNNKKIKYHYSELSKQREMAFLKLVHYLKESDLLREEILELEYHSLYKRIEVISNFWFSSLLIQTRKLSKNLIEEYALLISKSLYPYLTNEGRNQYATYFPSHLIHI